MMTSKVEATPSLLCGPVHDIHCRSIVPGKIDIYRGESVDRISEVTGERNRFEKHFGNDYCRPQVDEHSPFQLRDHRSQQTKVAQAPFTNGCAIGLGMHI